MTCPQCNSQVSYIIDSRPEGTDLIMRRRQCNACGKRWTTYEMPHKKYKEFINGIRHKNGGNVNAT